MKKYVHFGLTKILEMTLVAGFLFTPASFDKSAVLRTQVAEAFSQNGDEFVGPFASWANVKTQYSAVGNGASDDTTALQNALNDLGQSGKASVMYLPSGMYRITRTLTLAARVNVSIIGEDPATTFIVWDGSAGGTMLYINGVAFSRFDRLTWDGKSRAGIAIDQSKSDGTSNYFDTQNEYADDVFTDVGIGIRGGYLGFGFAETSVLRCRFIRNSLAGIALGNFNALDLFVWNSKFEDCYFGVTNELNGVGAGGFSIYNSIFKNSTSSDIFIGHTDGNFSFRNNFSSSSNRFIYTTGTANPAIITIQENTILDPVHQAIQIANLGPVFLIDNVIRSLATVSTGPVVTVASWEPSDLFSIGNTFTVTDPLYVWNWRLHSLDDQIVTRASITTAEPILPGPLPNYHRQVFEVPPGSSAAAIQEIINTAAAQNGSRPVVHLPPTNLNTINATLVIPANNDLQIVGDGAISKVIWTGSGSGPVFRLAGPSKATLRDFFVNGADVADGIIVENTDQPGSRVFMEQPFLLNLQQNLFVDGLDYTNLQLQDFYHYGSNTSLKVVGGPSAAAGTWLGGKTNIFSGQSSNSKLVYEVLQGARVAVRDVWYEAQSSPQFIHLTGNGVFSLSGSHIYLPISSTLPAIAIDNFTGKATFLDTTMWGNLAISGNGSQAKVLGIGLVGPSQNYFFNNASPPAQALLLNSMTRKSTEPNITGAQPVPEQGVYDAAFIRDMLDQIRTAQPSGLTSLPSGVTDLRLYRLQIQQALTGIHLKGSGNALTTLPNPPTLLTITP